MSAGAFALAGAPPSSPEGGCFAFASVGTGLSRASPPWRAEPRGTSDYALLTLSLSDRPTQLTQILLVNILNHMVQYSANASIDRVAMAISDSTRRAIIARLARGPARISDLAKPFPMSLTGFCKHVRVLERAGLVRRTRRGRDNTLRLSAQPLHHVARWVLKYEQYWNSRLDQLQQFFAAQKEQAP